MLDIHYGIAIPAAVFFALATGAHAQGVDLVAGDKQIETSFIADGAYRTIGKVVVTPTSAGVCAVTASGNFDPQGARLIYTLSKSPENSEGWGNPFPVNPGKLTPWTLSQTFKVKAGKKYRFRLNAKASEPFPPDVGAEAPEDYEARAELMRIWAICS